MHQIKQIEAAVVMPAGFRAIHLAYRADAVDAGLADALRHVEQPVRSERHTAGLQPLRVRAQRGQRVLDMVHRFEAVNGVSVPYRIVARRPGDVASCYADPSKAFEELGWKAVKTLDDMVRDSWMWQLKGAKN